MTLTKAKSERTSVPPTTTLPALIVVAPPKVLEFARVSVPEPFLVRAADMPPDITPVRLVLLAPVMVRVRVPAEMLPEIVRVPASDWTEVSPASVIGPPKVLVPLRLRSAPAPPKPAPVRLSGSEATLTEPWSSREAPVATTVPEVASPRPLAPLTLTVPALTLTAPWKVLLPPRVSLPLPVLVRPAVEPVMAPETTVLPAPVKVTSFTSATIEVALLSVSVPASDWTVVAPPRVTVPPKVFAPVKLRSAPLEALPVPEIASASAPTVMPPWSSREAPEDTLVPAPTPPRALEWARLTRPEETVVAPE